MKTKKKIKTARKCFHYRESGSKTCRMGTGGPLGQFSKIEKSRHEHWRAWQSNSDSQRLTEKLGFMFGY